MIEYSRHIEFYESYHWAGFSRLVPDAEWGDKKLAEEYSRQPKEEQEEIREWLPQEYKELIK